MAQIIVDASGLRCPLPLLKLKQALNRAEAGDEINLIATDAGSWRDVPAFIELSEHELTCRQESADEYRFTVIKGESS